MGVNGGQKCFESFLADGVVSRVEEDPEVALL